MSLEPKVNISNISIKNVVLIEYIIQTFIEIFQVKQNNSSTSFHTNFDLVDISANLSNDEKYNSM